ncbi:hypothetical protein CBW46_012410 [Paenibacillus xerothermodurans]|uniref:Uncharacterized protein n=1 Tax=Paenibacillus xerothermodurans TaxID=1977292 RepID=A0A2W1P0G3_PAEXE|nr:hypothetical protein CBW46_012410 [Paenibacillus xerothermodurans]
MLIAQHGGAKIRGIGNWYDNLFMKKYIFFKINRLKWNILSKEEQLFTLFYQCHALLLTTRVVKPMLIHFLGPISKIYK